MPPFSLSTPIKKRQYYGSVCKSIICLRKGGLAGGFAVGNDNRPRGVPGFKCWRKKNHCIAFTKAKGLLKKGKLLTEAIVAQRSLQERTQIPVSPSPLFVDRADRRILLTFIFVIRLQHSPSAFKRHFDWQRKAKRDRCTHWGRLIYNWTCKHLQATVIFTVVWIILSWLVLIGLSGAM